MRKYKEPERPQSSGCVIYARVSTSRQATENASIETQLEACRSFAESRGWEVVAEYVDPGASAWKDTGRPQFDRMLGQARRPNPPFDVVIVYDQSRFYRNLRQSEATRFELRVNGVRVQSVMQPFEDDGLFGSFAISMQAAMDEQQSRVTSMKVRAGLAANARAGFYVGGNVPYGYTLEVVDKLGNKNKHKLAIEPEEAAVIRLIFEMYQAGSGYMAITKHLNDQGYRSRTGKQWYKSVLGRILNSTTYVGRHVFRPTNPVTRKTVPKSEWIEIACPSIVSDAQFENVQRLIEVRDPEITPARYTTSDAVLGKIAKCGSCGGNLQIATGTSRTGDVHHYYKCAAKLNKGSCPGGNAITIRRDELETAVVEKMADDLMNADRVRETIARAVDQQQSARGDASTRLQQLKRQHKDVQRKQENLWELAAALGAKARDGFLAKLDALEEEAASFERQISANERMLSESVQPLSAHEAAAKVVQMRKLLLGADVQKQRRFVHALVEKVVVSEDAIQIYAPESNFAETVSDLSITAPLVRGSDRGWWALTGSNRRPSRCKRDALPTELSALSGGDRRAAPTPQDQLAVPPTTLATLK